MILDLLKKETTQQHQDLEKRLDLLNPHLTRQGYRQILECFLGYYEPIETALLKKQGWAELGFEPSLRKKVPALKQDLLSLGLNEFQVQSIPRASLLDFPSLNTPEQCVGCLYVLEGATLGGQIISRHLTSLLSIEPTTGGKFFAGYGARTGERWREFRTFCESFASTLKSPDQTIESARDTFQKFSAWAKGCPAFGN